MKWETVIGLEVHAQLKTKSKLFSGAPTAYGALPNSQTSIIDAGFPGVLPVLNQEAVRLALIFGLSVDAIINNLSYFERKNYFYPDLPKGYQISQYQYPIIGEGYLEIILSDGRKKKIKIVRAHLEEDAGKSIHEAYSKHTGIDLNRAGTPLLEIVTAPCLFSAEEAVTYLKTLHQLLRFLDVCDGNMQEGSFRCDVNLSLRPAGSQELGVRTELKNLNSFRFIEKAILYEQQRHQDRLESGGEILQETRLFSPATGTTHAIRSKENEMDYRYFPDPDLLPIKITAHELEVLKNHMPPLPSEIKAQLHSANLSGEEIDFLLSSPALYRFFNDVYEETDACAKTIVNWLKGPYSAALNENQLSFNNPPVSANNIAILLNRIADNSLSLHRAKSIFSSLLEGHSDIEALIAAQGNESQLTQEALEKIIRSVISDNPQQVADYRAGKEKLLAYFIGQVMKQAKGQADPTAVNKMLLTLLS